MARRRLGLEGSVAPSLQFYSINQGVNGNTNFRPGILVDSLILRTKHYATRGGLLLMKVYAACLSSNLTPNLEHAIMITNAATPGPRTRTQKKGTQDLYLCTTHHYLPLRALESFIIEASPVSGRNNTVIIETTIQAKTPITIRVVADFFWAAPQPRRRTRLARSGCGILLSLSQKERTMLWHMNCFLIYRCRTSPIYFIMSNML